MRNLSVCERCKSFKRKKYWIMERFWYKSKKYFCDKTGVMGSNDFILKGLIKHNEEFDWDGNGFLPKKEYRKLYLPDKCKYKWEQEVILQYLD